MHPTDAALVEQCVKGQKDAFAEIVQRYQHLIYYISLTRMRDRYEADDLAQETFIQAYRKLATYDSHRSFRSWLLCICVNLGKNRLRSRARRREVHNPHLELEAVTSHDQNQSRIDLMDALHKMPEKFRIPLVLKHVEGFSYDEIAAIMKIGTSAVKMRVKRGRDELVRNLSGSSVDPAQGKGDAGKPYIPCWVP